MCVCVIIDFVSLYIIYYSARVKEWVDALAEPLPPLLNTHTVNGKRWGARERERERERERDP